MIHYVVGDATRPKSRGLKYIAHVCNDVGAWGNGFVMAVSARWSQPERAYRLLGFLRLGEIQFVPVERDLIVVNMIAQRGVVRYGEPLVRYDHLRMCLNKLSAVATPTRGSVHMPRIGCGLGGGEWSIVEEIVNDTLNLVQVYVYDLEVKAE